MAHISARSMARQAAMQLLYERMAGGEADDESIDLIYEQLSMQVEKDENNSETVEIKPGKERHYIDDVVNGVIEHEEELDETIRKYSTGSWALDRVPRVDLSILRVAAYELYHRSDVPDAVAISEATNMARRYSEPKSTRYINGVLGAMERAKNGNTEDEA